MPTFCRSTKPLLATTVQRQDGIGLNHDFFTQLAGDDRFTDFYFGKVRCSGCKVWLFSIQLTTATTTIGIVSVAVHLEQFRKR